MKNEYTCANCGLAFENAWSDEEAKEEAKKNFGKDVKDWNSPAAVICDDCYQKYHPDNHPEEVAKTKEVL